jgi:dihydroflavonol-4-reductase
MKKFFVTGGCGHLGLTIVEDLVSTGNNVRVLALPGDKGVENLPKGVEIFNGNVTSKEDVESFLSNDNNDDTIVIHCAGIVSIASKYNQLVYDVNVNGTKNIVDVCLDKKVKKLIHVSSVHAIKEKPNHELITEASSFDPNEVFGLYAKTKSEATAYVLDACKKGLNASVVHPSGIIGPNDYGHGHITQLIIDYCNGGLTAAVKGGYDFVDVRDVSLGIIKSIEKGKPGECYILSNKYVEVRTLLDLLSKITQKKKISTYLPLWFANLTAPIAETYYKLLKQPPLYTAYSLYTLKSNSNFSHEKADEELGYTNRDFEKTLEDTVDFLKMTKRIH